MKRPGESGNPGEGNGERRPGPGDREERSERERAPGRTLSAAEVWRLIAATYRTSLPYLLLFIAGLLLATWLLTELVF